MAGSNTGRLGKLALLCGSLLVCFVALEFIVFRWILVPDDLLPNVTINDVVRYMPKTEAVFRHPDGRNSLVTINADGWNATKPKYQIDKQADRLRVAVIGDSYVHASFVDVDKAFPEVLERQLQSRGLKSEVYRFGMDGAPLSQHLQVLRNEVLTYRPDIVVVQLIHNDFDEAYRLMRTRYTSSFLKLSSDQNGNIIEIPPSPFRPGLADFMRSFATFRYLYYETNLYLTLKSYISRYFWGGDEEYRPEFISSAVDIRNLQEPEKLKLYTRYIFEQLQQLSRTHGFKLVLTMDGVRDAIYSGKPITEYEVAKLNGIAGEMAGSLGIPFIDLHATFAEHYDANKQRFEFAYDWHWNELGNQVVGSKIADVIANDSGLLSAVQPTLGKRTQAVELR